MQIVNIFLFVYYNMFVFTIARIRVRTVHRIYILFSTLILGSVLIDHVKLPGIFLTSTPTGDPFSIIRSGTRLI